MNHHIELRDIDWMLADDKKTPKALYDSLNQYIKKRKNILLGKIMKMQKRFLLILRKPF
jgi:hypothetical protein